MSTHPRRGFTIIELLVSIAVIGILSGIIYGNFSGAAATGRDAERQSDLRILQNAIELHKNKYGRYPVQGCGTAGASFANEVDCSNYINGLVPEFLSRLPRDPNRGNNDGYSYLTNDNGTVYKLMIAGTVESETVDSSHPFQSCDVTYCPTTGNNACNRNDLYDTSYAVWGGFELLASSQNGNAWSIDVFAPNPLVNLTSGQPLSTAHRQEALEPTTNIICQNP